MSEQPSKTTRSAVTSFRVAHRSSSRKYALQRDPRFWNEPERFNPDRFLTDKINRNTFLPFSIGPRKCMGTRMAYIEGTLVLGAILQRYAFQIRDGWTPRHRVRVSTGLAGGLPARLFAR